MPFEHLGIAIAEAMSAGVVPIALDAGGPAEIITDGKNGLLIGNAAEIATETLALLDDPARLRRLSLAATRRAADFTPERFADKFARAVSECGEGPGAAAEAAQ